MKWSKTKRPIQHECKTHSKQTCIPLRRKRTFKSTQWGMWSMLRVTDGRSNRNKENSSTTQQHIESREKTKQSVHKLKRWKTRLTHTQLRSSVNMQLNKQWKTSRNPRMMSHTCQIIYNQLKRMRQGSQKQSKWTNPGGKNQSRGQDALENSGKRPKSKPTGFSATVQL